MDQIKALEIARIGLVESEFKALSVDDMYQIHVLAAGRIGDYEMEINRHVKKEARFFRDNPKYVNVIEFNFLGEHFIISTKDPNNEIINNFLRTGNEILSPLSDILVFREIKDKLVNTERYIKTSTHLIINHNHSLKKNKKKYAKIDMFRYAAYCIDTKGRIDLAERFKSWKKFMKQLKKEE